MSIKWPLPQDGLAFTWVLGVVSSNHSPFQAHKKPDKGEGCSLSVDTRSFYWLWNVESNQNKLAWQAGQTSSVDQNPSHQSALKMAQSAQLLSSTRLGLVPCSWPGRSYRRWPKYQGPCHLDEALGSWLQPFPSLLKLFLGWTVRWSLNFKREKNYEWLYSFS